MLKAQKKAEKLAEKKAKAKGKKVQVENLILKNFDPDQNLVDPKLSETVMADTKLEGPAVCDIKSEKPDTEDQTSGDKIKDLPLKEPKIENPDW